MAGAREVTALVRRLRSGSRVAQLHVMNELHPLLINSAGQRAAFVAAGGIEAALQLMRSGTPVVRLEGTRLLGSALKQNTAACQALLAAGGVQALVQQLGDSIASGHPDMLATTVAAMCMAASPDCADVNGAIVAAGAAPMLVSLLRRYGSDGKPLGCACLVSQLARVGSISVEAVAACGAVEAIVQLLQRAQDGATQRDGLISLGQLADVSPPGAEAAAAAGAIPAAVQCLGSGDARTQTVAAGLLGQLVSACPQLRGAVVEAGGLTALEQLLPNSSGILEEWVAKAIAIIHEAEAAEAEEPTSGTAPAAAAGMPATPTPRARPPRMCAAPGCGATRGLKRCASCCAVRYCSAECQRMHWRAHSAECRRLQAERAAMAEAAADEADAESAV